MKIFCIGLPRTGTTSLVEYINRNSNYRVGKLLFNEQVKKNLMACQYKMKEIDEIDGVADLVSCAFYQEFYHYYPDSKFIYVTRDLASWKRSCRNWFSKNTIKNDQLYHSGKPSTNWLSFFTSCVFKSYLFNEILFENVYNNYHNNVLSFFENKKESLLHYDLNDPKKEEKINNFLGIQGKFFKKLN